MCELPVSSHCNTDGLPNYGRGCIMSERAQLSPAGKLTIVGLVVAAVGIVIQVLSGVAEYPTIPPGFIILLVAAGVVALETRWRWTPILGLAVALFILFGAFVTPGTANRLSNPAAVGAFVGTVVQLLGLVTAAIAGLVSVIRNYRG